MERTVPSTASEEVELYLRTYYSLLRSTTDVHIRTLEEVHAVMRSLLHPNARESTPDVGAFIYSLLRLPACIHTVQLVVLGQSTEVFARHGYEQLESWETVSAVARRRRCFYNQCETLACFIASRSEIDDVIPILTAFQIVPILYNVSIAFTNYSTGNIGTKPEAIDTIIKDSVAESDNSVSYDMVPALNPTGDLVLLLTPQVLEAAPVEETPVDNGTGADTEFGGEEAAPDLGRGEGAQLDAAEAGAVVPSVKTCTWPSFIIPTASV
jgi:hypothetical protein